MLEARSINPNDQRYEFDEPSYRVFFWSQPDGIGSNRSWRSDEWEISGADIDEALTWVLAHAAGRRASLWAVTRPGGEATHVRLAGTDPTAPDDTWPAWADAAWPRPSGNRPHP